MKAMTLAVMAIAGLLATASCTVALAQREGVIAGAGTIPCGEYLEDRKQNRHGDYYASWAVGFLAAYNMFGTKPQIEIPQRDTIHAYLEKHCRDNPLDRVVRGVIGLIGELGGWRAPFLEKGT